MSKKDFEDFIDFAFKGKENVYLNKSTLQKEYIKYQEHLKLQKAFKSLSPKRS